jgi:hypothetical protein
MGQILGIGYGGGTKSTGTSTPQVPPEMRHLYGQVTDVAGSNIDAFKSLLSRVMAGDRSAIAPYAAPAAAAYTAPMASQLQNVLAMIQRQVPRGGSQDAAMASAMRQGGMDIGQAYGKVAQQDVESQNAMMQKVLAMYSSIFGGFNPAAQIGGKQVTESPARFGLPFADVPLG